MTLYVVLSTLLCFFVAKSLMDSSCAISRNGATKFSINTRRNQTGHWTTKVNFQRGTEHELSEPSNVVDVTVEQNTETCEGMETVNIATTVIIPPPRPAPDYTFFPNFGYYKIHTAGQKWRDALKTCSSEGAHLVILNSEEESLILRDLFARYPKISGVSNGDHGFIGYHDLYVEGHFTTIFGEPLNSTGFTRWSHPGQPNNGGDGVDSDSDCGGVHRNGGLNDLPCNWKCPFFCEQELW